MIEPSWTSEPEGDRTIEANWLLQLRRERFRSRRSGHPHDFYVLHLADSVTTVALTTDQQIVLVRQFRAGSKLDHWETPGGLLLPDEDPAEAGPRELLEETGFAGNPPITLGTVWTNPALATSRMTSVLITEARRIAEPTPDVGEEVEVGLFPRAEVERWLKSGRIDHALANLALSTWFLSKSPSP